MATKPTRMQQREFKALAGRIREELERSLMPSISRDGSWTTVIAVFEFPVAPAYCGLCSSQAVDPPVPQSVVCSLRFHAFLELERFADRPPHRGLVDLSQNLRDQSRFDRWHQGEPLACQATTIEIRKMQIVTENRLLTQVSFVAHERRRIRLRPPRRSVARCRGGNESASWHGPRTR